MEDVSSSFKASVSMPLKPTAHGIDDGCARAQLVLEAKV
jgi:hypothetical protein